MIFQKTWEKFVADWKSFAIMALGLLISYLVIAVVAAFASLSVVVRLLMSIPDLDYLGYYLDDPEYLLPLLGQFGFTLLVLVIVSVLVTAFMAGGLMGSLVAYRRGEAVTLGLFFNLGKRYWVRMLGIVGIATAISCVLMLLLVIPFLGCVLVVLAFPLVVVYCGFYPWYMVVAEEKGALDAIGASFRALTRDFKEAAMGGGVCLLMCLVVWLASVVVVFIPLVGPLAVIALAYLSMTLIAHYFIDRFEIRVRPVLDG